MDIQALASELSGDPLARGYAGMSDAAAAASLNDTIDRTTNKSSMSGDEIFAATDSTEYDALTTDQKQLWLAFCGRDTVDPFGTANVAFVVSLFGNPSTTRTALINGRVNSVSRATELGLGLVKPGHVGMARG